MLRTSSIDTSDDWPVFPLGLASRIREPCLSACMRTERQTRRPGAAPGNAVPFTPPMCGMVEGGRGRVIVNNTQYFSRRQCWADQLGQTNYAAAKAGVTAMTVTWAKELARATTSVLLESLRVSRRHAWWSLFQGRFATGSSRSFRYDDLRDEKIGRAALHLAGRLLQRSNSGD